MVTAYTDGACRGNPGPSSCAFAVIEEGKHAFSDGIYLGDSHTNNYAEYQGLLHLLRYLNDEEIRGVTIYCDSALVVNQVNGRWQVKHEEIKPLAYECIGLFMRGQHKLVHIRGHQGVVWNEFVDRLCNEVLDEQMD